MSFIGQIVYNLEDYHYSGGKISSNKSDFKNVISSADDEYDSEAAFLDASFPIYSDIITSLQEQITCEEFLKVGIQAPAGTVVQIATNSADKNASNYQKIIIGRNGVFELDYSNVCIKGLYFEKTKNYILDEPLTELYLAYGAAQIEKAKNFLVAAIARMDDETLRDDEGNVPDRVSDPANSNYYVPILMKDYSNKSEYLKDYYNQYVNAHVQYLKLYNTGVYYLQAGLNGVYELPSDLRTNYKVTLSTGTDAKGNTTIVGSKDAVIAEDIFDSAMVTALSDSDKDMINLALSSFQDVLIEDGKNGQTDEIELKNVIIDFVY